MNKNFLFSFSFLEFDGLFLSNGPGDPQTQCPETIATIASWIKSDTIKPVFGICLGHQVKIFN
jgi:carbamoyl-phosphate synthase small subunit